MGGLLKSGWGWAAAALLAAGCAGLEEPLALDPFPVQYRLFTTPKDLIDEYAYPSDQTRHRLRWENNEFEWQIRFPPRGHAYGGLRLRRAVDLAQDRRVATIRFTLQPGTWGNSLSIAFVDDPTNGTPVLVDLPVLDKPSAAPQRALNIRIPLRNFPDRGPVLEEVVEERPFDWSRVREIRFIAAGDRPDVPLTIRNLRFEK